MDKKKIALLVHNYFEQSEFEAPLMTLRKQGAEVTVISADKIKMQALQRTKSGRPIEADLLLTAADSDAYDALVLPGGVVNADKLRMDMTARAWVLAFLGSGRLVAAICHAPWLLVSADVVEERRLTSYYTLQDDIRNAGGEWSDHPVIIDHNLITSRGPNDLPAFTDAITAWLQD
ncbi:MAG TPA: type 1 glutamine amidotransferase domain-containing protein [Candidatus Pristimantibacillus sp.]|jgi:protease I|nr:type 1 glutamine amidotransferase domain-containing protein [Candidatus Pristimantibacillus sp.]